MPPRFPSLVLAALLIFGTPAMSAPLVTPFQQALAQAAAEDDAVAAFYRARSFAPIWMGDEADGQWGPADRREAFLRVLSQADRHGLPKGRYDADAIRAEFAAANDAAARGALEVAMTRRFLRFARDIGTGILDPKRVDPTIVLDVPAPDRTELLHAFTDGNPHDIVRSLAPTSPHYARLLRERMRLAEMATKGGWGAPVADVTLRPGAEGPAVVALRNRLIRMGYLHMSPTARYGAAMEAAIRAFQIDHGLTPDGEVGPATIAALNVPIEDRMAQILVGLERQRWMNKPLEPRHILVNLAEQHAYVVDDGKVTFDTVVVVGADTPDRRTPEFSHTMTHMVVNPSWYVPRSITVNEYLPALKRGGARHLEVYSRSGRVNPNNVDFSRYNARNFPFSLRQPPGPRNALGRVKFMFPNRWNIYLHDTPSRSLFARDLRTFSHGCVRVADPLELAYHLLAPQTDTPRQDFDRVLRSGAERRMNLEQPIGVHIVYWSAWVTPTGRANYRGDPYGRDVRVRDALRAAGVELGASRS
ncbi:L,D-transpeptidase family protein [Jannaschia sp. S6380]|uniref:L,D-transpeptidase family protein n=1 Tax=Jannaschia sp. S6380 TaxID=2926408 RepID=UPI001FF4E742|nr:L,D-transpeptidase family protein [Jannaschia sp. S6380]MCK0166443.1 L,D-transpeptidase family protein [Jannaschia sp. S6380]